MIQTFSPADFAGQIARGDGMMANRLQKILAIPKAAQTEYEVSAREAAAIRRRIYDINKHHPRGYRFRTMRDGSLLLVWRIK